MPGPKRGKKNKPTCTNAIASYFRPVSSEKTSGQTREELRSGPPREESEEARRDKSGGPSPKKSGRSTRDKAGEPSPKKSGEPSPKKSGGPSPKKSGGTSTKKSGGPPTKKSDGPSSKKSGDPSTKKRGDPSTKKSGTRDKSGEPNCDGIDEGDATGPGKRKADAVELEGKTDPKKRKSGIDPTWKKDFPWMKESADGEGMYCTYCIKHHPSKAGVKSWIDVPCTTIERYSLRRHAATTAHIAAAAKEDDARAAEETGGIAQALKRQVSLERSAFLGALRAMYWLTKNEIAHSTNFPSLLDMMKGLGLTYLAHLNKAGNASYTSDEIMSEMVKVLSDVPRKEILNCIRNSPYFSLMIDETTDVAVTKQLIIYARYLTEKHKVKTSFLGIVAIDDGKADTIVAAIQAFLTSVDLDINRMAGFGSDGAAVMVGRRNGVAAQLRAANGKLVNVHCIAHRLALSAAQGADGIPYLQKWKDLLGQLYRFYEYSPVRMAGLKNIQKVLDSSVKLVQAKDVRWLSHDAAVKALRKTFAAVVMSLEREATERSEAAARGLALFLKDFKFCATLMMMSDILPKLTKLSKVFQRKDVNFSDIHDRVGDTIDGLMKLKQTPGENFSGLDGFLQKNAAVTSEIKYTQEDMDKFMKDIYLPFLDNIMSNLKERFPDTVLLSAFNIFNPEEAEYDHQDRLELLCEHYAGEVEDLEEIESEHDVFADVLRAHYSGLTTTQVLRKVMKVHGDTMPNLAKLAAAASVIPVSTADCERGFSTMKRVKTPLRNRMNESTLNNLLMISVEGPPAEEFDFNAACDSWGKMAKRRLNVMS
ncbi:zinc finger protein 862-like [Branchiostoma floridae x Branchiostoma japonicum]